MELLLICLFVASLSVIFVSIYFLIRNQFVYAFRMTRIKEASHCTRFILATTDTHRDNRFLEPYHRLEAVSYDQMLYSLRPLRFFIHDKWLDDIYEQYEKIANAKRTASFREKHVGETVLVGAANRQLEAGKQGRSESDVGRGEVEQG